MLFGVITMEKGQNGSDSGSEDDRSVTGDWPVALAAAAKGAPVKMVPAVHNRLVCAWTVEVERLFSKCSKVMKADRRKMHPRIFEAIVCLKENAEWWDLDLVQEMLAGVWDAELDNLYMEYGDLEYKDDKGEEDEEDEDNEF